LMNSLYFIRKHFRITIQQGEGRDFWSPVKDANGLMDWNYSRSPPEVDKQYPEEACAPQERLCAFGAFESAWGWQVLSPRPENPFDFRALKWPSSALCFFSPVSYAYLRVDVSVQRDGGFIDGGKSNL
jgi:hypothetical protein